MRRGPNPMHGYTVANGFRTLCGVNATRKRRVLIPAESEKLLTDRNPCFECTYVAKQTTPIGAVFDRVIDVVAGRAL